MMISIFIIIYVNDKNDEYSLNVMIRLIIFMLNYTEAIIIDLIHVYLNQIHEYSY